MKKTDLVSYIKENIRTSLSTQNEASEEEVKNQADLNKELEKTVQLQKDMGISEDEEEIKEPTKSQLQRGAGSLTRVGYQLADLTKEMKDLAKKYKAAEGAEKEKIKDKLKIMTVKKKDLESKL